MDPFLFCLLISAVVMRAPSAIVDAYAAKKAADAGEWEWLKARAERNDARAARRAEWAQRILDRRRTKAEGRGPKRAGLGTLLGDIYHGACEDALTRRAAKRTGRRPADPKGGKPSRWRARWDAAWAKVEDKVAAWRTPRPEVDPPTAAPNPVVGDDVVEEYRDDFDDEGLDRLRDGRCVWANDPPATGYCGEPVAPDTLYCQPHVDEWYRTAATPGEARTSDEPAPVAAPTTDRTEGVPMTAPAAAPAGTAAGSATIEDVQTNEAARRAFEQMGEGAAQLGEAASMAEAARAKIAAAALAAGDGMASVAFDAGATAAVADINDTVHDGTLHKWSETADQIQAAAQKGHADLEKYRPAEEIVADNNVDARTVGAEAS